jgi:hypothetical protein
MLPMTDETARDEDIIVLYELQYESTNVFVLWQAHYMRALHPAAPI